MKEEDIRNYASLMKELELTGLEIEIDGAKVRLERGNGTAIPQSYTVAPEAPKAEKAEEKEAAGEAVTSPMVGVFYSAPAENSEPFVTVGAKVRKGETICIIEAMKLMNEIKAECDGRILEICAENGSLVEYGSRLFRIAKDE